MSLQHMISTCYPKYKELGRVVETLPLSARSLLIKLCQSQNDLFPEDNSTLARLFDEHPQIVYPRKDGISISIPLRELFPQLNITVNDPLQSAIILDILRCSHLAEVEVRAAKEKGWATEIRLSETPGRPTTNFDAFFFDMSPPLHPDLPHNPFHLQAIRYRFKLFKRDLLENKRIFYRRSSQKNMSRGTRRDFEATFNSSLDDWSIFGQDDWRRVYHETGIKLGGLVEMRQTWTPAVAKPRTYFAMGGICYDKSSFLQNFFTDLVDLFPATNHISRLRPSRLRLSLDFPDHHYLIYDLTSFTSNLKELIAFMWSLKEFFRDVPVVIVDEYFGPCESDLGMLLDEYYDTCVLHPELSYERCCFEDAANISNTYHGRASLLGIFGNLMCSTLCHYLILSPCVDTGDEINIAGDDGLVLETLLNKYHIDAAINVVGDCAREKTFRSNETSAICLKRPIMEIPPSLLLFYNIIPPNLAVSISYLMGAPCSKRFEIRNLEDKTELERVSVVGKDLLRFLESAYLHGCHEEDIVPVFRGFCGLVERIARFYPVAGNLGKINSYIWPIDPSKYDWYSISPLDVYAMTCCQGLEFHVKEERPIDVQSLKFAGDVSTGNSSQRLVMLEKLGYLEKRSITYSICGLDSAAKWLSLQRRKIEPPTIYEYTCNKDIPSQFIFSESELI